MLAAELATGAHTVARTRCHLCVHGNCLAQTDTHTYGVMYARKGMHEYKENANIHTQRIRINKARVGNAVCKPLTILLNKHSCATEAALFVRGKM